MCEAWLTFEGFFADNGVKPEGTSLGRFKDKGDYAPGNCKWMTRAEQELEKKRGKQ